MSAFMTAFKGTYGLLNAVKKRAIWWHLFKLRIWTRNSRIVVGWFAVLNENHMFIWVEI